MLEIAGRAGVRNPGTKIRGIFSHCQIDSFFILDPYFSQTDGEGKKKFLLLLQLTLSSFVYPFHNFCCRSISKSFDHAGLDTLSLL